MGLMMSHSVEDTPLSKGDKSRLKIKTLTSETELHDVEMKNICRTMEWSDRCRLNSEELLSETFVYELHKRLFGDIWNWAGKKRTDNLPGGVDKFQISVELTILLGNCKSWIENRTYPEDEIAIRIHHKLQQIQVFSARSGTHSRLYADIMISQLFGKPEFTWGLLLNLESSELSERYQSALSEASKGRFEPLIIFARS